MSANVFVDDRILLDVGFDAARRQLEHLACDGVLLGAAEYAYGVGITGLAETVGPAAGMSRLAGVRADDIADTPDGARLWLRWEAIGPDGAVYPALDAVLTLTRAGEAITSLALAGVYRLPGPAGAGSRPRCRALFRRRGHPQLHRPARLRPDASRWRGTLLERVGKARRGAVRIAGVIGATQQEFWADPHQRRDHTSTPLRAVPLFLM